MTKLSKNTYNHEKKTAGYYAGRVLTVISWFIAFCTASSGIITLFHGADDGSLSIQRRVIYFVICVIITAAFICLGNWGRRISKKNVIAKKTTPKEPVVEASAIGSAVQVQTEMTEAVKYLSQITVVYYPADMEGEEQPAVDKKGYIHAYRNDAGLKEIARKNDMRVKSTLGRNFCEQLQNWTCEGVCLHDRGDHIVMYSREDLGLSADKNQYHPVRFFDPDRKSDIHTDKPSLKDVFMEISASSPHQKDMLKHVKFSENYIISDYNIISHYRPEYKRPSIVITKDQYEVKLGPDDDMRGPAGLKRFTDIREAMRYFVEGLDNHYKWEELKQEKIKKENKTVAEQTASHKESAPEEHREDSELREKARAQKLEEFKAFMQNDGKLPEEFSVVENTIRKNLLEETKDLDWNRGDYCNAMFLQLNEDCDFHSSLQKIIRWKKKHLSFRWDIEWEDEWGSHCHTISCPQGTGSEYRMFTMLLSREKPDLTNEEISELKKAKMTICWLVGKESYYDWLEDLVYGYHYRECGGYPGSADDAATYGASAVWSKYIVASGEAARELLLNSKVEDSDLTESDDMNFKEKSDIDDSQSEAKSLREKIIEDAQNHLIVLKKDPEGNKEHIEAFEVFIKVLKNQDALEMTAASTLCAYIYAMGYYDIHEASRISREILAEAKQKYVLIDPTEIKK